MRGIYAIDVPMYADCKHGCKDKRGFPILAKLDDITYRYLNTRELYLLRHCPKCNGSSIIFFERR